MSFCLMNRHKMHPTLLGICHLARQHRRVSYRSEPLRHLYRYMSLLLVLQESNPCFDQNLNFLSSEIIYSPCLQYSLIIVYEILLSCQSLHEFLDVCFMDHVIGIMTKLEPAAHDHTIALVHGFPGSVKRHSGTYDNGELS